MSIELLVKFTAKTDIRQWLSEPFNIDGKTCASDGAVMVTLPLLEGFKEIESQESKDRIKNILADFPNQYSSLTEKPALPVKRKCKYCEGSGKITTTDCKECDGVGDVCFENDFNEYEFECMSCHGSGNIKSPGNGEDCSVCGGTGSTYIYGEWVFIEGVRLDPVYAELLLSMDDVRVHAADDTRLYFKCGDAEGVMLGMRA